MNIVLDIHSVQEGPALHRSLIVTTQASAYNSVSDCKIMKCTY